MKSSIAIYGERCSGTNLMESLVRKNSDLKLVYPFGFKHFPNIGITPEKLEESRGIPVIILIRHPEEWLRSLYLNPWHAIDSVRQLEFPDFIRAEWRTHWAEESGTEEDDIQYGKPIREDLDLETGDFYRNPMELRNGKIRLFKKIANIAEHCVWVRLEDLVRDQESLFIQTCQELGFEIPDRTIPVKAYKGKESFKRKVIRITRLEKILTTRKRNKPVVSSEDCRYIWSHLDRDLEKSFGYKPTIGGIDLL